MRQRAYTGREEIPSALVHYIRTLAGSYVPWRSDETLNFIDRAADKAITDKLEDRINQTHMAIYYLRKTSEVRNERKNR